MPKKKTRVDPKKLGLKTVDINVNVPKKRGAVIRKGTTRRPINRGKATSVVSDADILRAKRKQTARKKKK